MFETRIDLSRWVLHFVHDRNIVFEPPSSYDDDSCITLPPCHEDNEMNRRYEVWECNDEYVSFDEDADAFSVLLKIIEDGHIRSGWSFRNAKPTIYGPDAACCFTEMPLYALIEYSRIRTSSMAGPYAIGLLRKELFAAGGRPVIYGLSSQHRELVRHQGDLFPWIRKLDPSCGIAEKEQYRYVAMALSGDKFIDWEHEREWRWSDGLGRCSCPGLPIWLKEEPVRFSNIFVVVKTQNEANKVLDKLKELYDAGSHDYGHEYNQAALVGTKVVALDVVCMKIEKDKFFAVRLDDIPSSSIEKFSAPEVSSEFVVYVSEVLREAHDAAEIAALECIDRRRGDGGYVHDICGFAYLVLLSVQSPLASALLALKEANVIGGVGFYVSRFGNHSHGEQALCVETAAARAAEKVFKHHFPELDFTVREAWD